MSEMCRDKESAIDVSNGKKIIKQNMVKGGYAFWKLNCAPNKDDFLA